MTTPPRKDRPIFFLAYLVAGAAMGGFLDVVVFRLPTPIYGIIGGALIATVYQAAIWISQSRRK